MTTLLLDLALARRIELAEAHAAVDCAKALVRLQPAAGAEVQAVAGGFAMYCGRTRRLRRLSLGAGRAG